MANIRGVQGGQAAPVAITAVEAGVTISASIDTSTPLDVVIGAGEEHLGAVGGNSDIIEVTPTLSVAGAYSSGDYVGESATPMSFSVGRLNGGTGVIHSAILIDKAKQSVETELWLFSAAPTPPNDNAAWSISDADAAYCIGVIKFSTYYASALNSVSPVSNVGLVFKTPIAADTIFGCLVTRGAPTYASGDLVVKLGVLQD